MADLSRNTRSSGVSLLGENTTYGPLSSLSSPADSSSLSWRGSSAGSEEGAAGTSRFSRSMLMTFSCKTPLNLRQMTTVDPDKTFLIRQPHWYGGVHFWRLFGCWRRTLSSGANGHSCSDSQWSFSDISASSRSRTLAHLAACSSCHSLGSDRLMRALTNARGCHPIIAFIGEMPMALWMRLL